MNKLEKMIRDKGWKILDKRIVLKNDPMAKLFGHVGRIEEWTVRKSDRSIVKTRIALWDVEEENDYAD